MKLENYEVHLPSYSIGDHIYDKIGPVCESYGNTVLLIGGRRALKAAEEKIRTYVAKTNLEIIGVELYGSDCTYDVEQVVLAIVVTTGIASIFLTKDFTPDYNSGLAHAIFYALTSYPVIEEKHLHGEVVGFGVLLALLVDQQYEEFEKIYTLNQQLQLPTSLEQIEITEEQWEESMDHIPEMSDIRHYPYKVTKEMLVLAMNQLKEREGGRLINE